MGTVTKGFGPAAASSLKGGLGGLIGGLAGDLTKVGLKAAIPECPEEGCQ